MSRTNKGGARLRAITLFAGAAAIAAGVFAAHSHKTPMVSTCYWDNANALTERVAVKAGSSVMLKCPGLASGSYDIQLTSNLNSGTTITGRSETQLANGVSVPTNGSLMNSVSAESATVIPAGGGATVAQSGSALQELVLDYTGTTTNVQGGSAAAELKANGLISGSTYRMKPFISGSFDHTGWANSGTGSANGSDASNLAAFPTSGGSAGLDVYHPSSSQGDTFINTVNPGGSFNVEVRLFDVKGNLIDSYPTITLHN